MSKISPAKSAPKLIVTMRSSLDAAADHIDDANLTPATKARMAQGILRIAAEGITDAGALFDAAIEEAKQPAE